MLADRPEKVMISTAASPISVSSKDGALKTPKSSSRVFGSVLASSRRVATPIPDEDIWKRLREVGLDEETLRQKDKAALISYITKLETDLYDYQHQMGLLLLEKKGWLSKYDQVKVEANSAQEKYKRDQARLMHSLAEAEKRELDLKTASGVKKECVEHLEKALREIRSESAEIKVAAETKLAEARTLEENAQKLSLTAESRLRTAEALEAEAKHLHAVAQRKLQEVEIREDVIKLKHVSFKTESETKEEELVVERQRLHGLQTVLQVGQETLLEGQSLLTQRENAISEKAESLRQLEEQLNTRKEAIEKELLVVEEEKSNLRSMLADFATREEAAIQRELLNHKKEQDLLVLQENIANKERAEIQRLMDQHELALALRKKEFEAELDQTRKLMEDELASREKSLQQKEEYLEYKEEQIQGKERDLDIQMQEVAQKENEIVDRLKALDDREENLTFAENKIKIDQKSLQDEREKLSSIKLNLDKLKEILENEKKQILHEQENLEIKESEREGLLALETKLKEEIDNVRAQRLELMAQAEELEAQKLKFEKDWELIDEKIGKLQQQSEQVAEEKREMAKFLKEERERLKLEKEALDAQLKCDSELLFHEQQAFLSKMALEHSEWLSNIQRERADIAQDIDIQKRELENNMKKRHEELERFLNDREESFQKEKARDLLHINSLRELAIREMEDVSLEKKQLEAQRQEIALDRERIEREWNEIKNDIQELQIQQEKLKKQRELLQKDREDIWNQIQMLRKLHDFNEAVENALVPASVLPELGPSKVKMLPTNQQNIADIAISKDCDEITNASLGLLQKQDYCDASSDGSVSWIRRCAERIFKRTPSKLVLERHEAKSRTTVAKSSELPILPERRSANSDLPYIGPPINDEKLSKLQTAAFQGQSFVSEEKYLHSSEVENIETSRGTQSMRPTEEVPKVIRQGEIPQCANPSDELSPLLSAMEKPIAYSEKGDDVDMKEKSSNLTNVVPNGSRVGRKRSCYGSKSKRASGRQKRRRHQKTNVDSSSATVQAKDKGMKEGFEQPLVIGDGNPATTTQSPVHNIDDMLGPSSEQSLANLLNFEVVQNNDFTVCKQSPSNDIAISSPVNRQGGTQSHDVVQETQSYHDESSNSLITTAIRDEQKRQLVEVVENVFPRQPCEDEKKFTVNF